MRFFSSSTVAGRLFSLLFPVEIKQPTLVCLLFFLVTLSSLLFGNLVESGGGSGEVSDDVSKTLLTKLTGKQAKVFAVGQVSGSLALFISGSSSKTDFNGGYQVTLKSEPADGRFNVDGAFKLSKYTAMTTPTDLMFICSSELITMNSEIIGALDFAANQFTKLSKIDSNTLPSCYYKGILHISTTEAKTFFIVDQSNGKVTKTAFHGESISLATSCAEVSDKPLGNLCKIGEDKISLSTSCSGSPPAGIISGYVGSSHAYLFDGDNTVYYFDASIFGGGGAQVDLKKANSSSAWFRQSAEVTTPSTIVRSTSKTDILYHISSIWFGFFIGYCVNALLSLLFLWLADTFCNLGLKQRWAVWKSEHGPAWGKRPWKIQGDKTGKDGGDKDRDGGGGDSHRKSKSGKTGGGGSSSSRKRRHRHGSKSKTKSHRRTSSRKTTSKASSRKTSAASSTTTPSSSKSAPGPPPPPPPVTPGGGGGAATSVAAQQLSEQQHQLQLKQMLKEYRQQQQKRKTKKRTSKGRTASKGKGSRRRTASGARKTSKGAGSGQRRGKRNRSKQATKTKRSARAAAAVLQAGRQSISVAAGGGGGGSSTTGAPQNSRSASMNSRGGGIRGGGLQANIPLGTVVVPPQQPVQQQAQPPPPPPQPLENFKRMPTPSPHAITKAPLIGHPPNFYAKEQAIEPGQQAPPPPPLPQPQESFSPPPPLPGGGGGQQQPVGGNNNLRATSPPQNNRGAPSSPPLPLLVAPGQQQEGGKSPSPKAPPR